MKPAAFSYFRPASIEEALSRLALLDNAKLIAGGQSLGPMMNMRLATPSALVDLNDLDELAYVREAGAMLEIGALTRHYQVAESELVRRRCPLLAQAARTIGHYAIRQRGTIGGSLAHADPAAQYALIAVTLDARIEVISVRGRRSIPASEFFLGVMATALAPDEMIRAVLFPMALAQEGAAFRLFNRRHGDFAIVAAATTVALEDGLVKRLRLGLAAGGAAPSAYQKLAAEFEGRGPNRAWIEELACAARAAIAPQDDAHIPAVYRRELAEDLVRRALERALVKARGAHEAQA